MKHSQQSSTQQATHTYIVIQGAVLVVRVDAEPGAFISDRVEKHTHGVSLHQTGQPLVDRQKLVALQVQQLYCKCVCGCEMRV